MANQIVLGAPPGVAPAAFSVPGGSSTVTAVAFRHPVSFPVLGSPVHVRQPCNSRYVTKCSSSGAGESAPGGSYGDPASQYGPGAQGPYSPPLGSGTGYGGNTGGNCGSASTGYSGAGVGGQTPRYMGNPSPPTANADFGWRRGTSGGPGSPATAPPAGYVQPTSAQNGAGYAQGFGGAQTYGTPPGGPQTYEAAPPGGPQTYGAAPPGGPQTYGAPPGGPQTYGAPPGGPQTYGASAGVAGVTGNPPNASSGGYGTPVSAPGYSPPPPGNTAHGASNGPGYGRSPPPGGNYAGTGARSSYGAPRGQAPYTPRGSPAAKSPPKGPMPEFKLPDGTNKWTSVDEMRRHYFPNAENEPPPKRTYKTPDPAAGGFVIPDGSRKWNSIDEMRRHYFPNEDFSQPPKRTYKPPDPKAGGFVLPDGSRKWNSIDEMRRHYFPNEDFSKPPKPFGSSNKTGGDKV